MMDHIPPPEPLVEDTCPCDLPANPGSRAAPYASLAISSGIYGVATGLEAAVIINHQFTSDLQS